MADVKWGDRDARGEWKPETLPEPSPLFGWPPQLVKIIKYVPRGLLWPVNVIIAAIAVAAWLWLTPSLERTSTFAFGWIAQLYLRNAAILLVVAGGLHLRQYTFRAQGIRYKYSDKWLATNDSKFLFRNQTYDNIFWNFASAVVFWTAYEALTLWMFSNGIIPMVTFNSHPVYFILIMFSVVLLRPFHFYWVHRLIHWKPLFRMCHYLHHKNINIGPWSGLAMHPLEHFIYFTGVVFHWIIPSHPIHAIFHLMHAGLSAPMGHIGFDELVGKRDKGVSTEFYFHYLHHKYFTVNFGDEVVPLDKWFGSHHDGSEEAHSEMLEKRKRKRGQPNEQTET